MPTDNVRSLPVPAGWYPDPCRRARYRRWNGRGWTDEELGAAAETTTANPVDCPAPYRAERLARHRVAALKAAGHRDALLLFGAVTTTVTVVAAGTRGRARSPDREAAWLSNAMTGLPDAARTDGLVSAGSPVHVRETSPARWLHRHGRYATAGSSSLTGARRLDPPLLTSNGTVGGIKLA